MKEASEVRMSGELVDGLYCVLLHNLHLDVIPGAAICKIHHARRQVRTTGRLIVLLSFWTALPVLELITFALHFWFRWLK